MAGSGKHPGKEALKNKAMLVVRNVTQQEVTNVIFPNGLTVGTKDLTNGAKVHGNVQVSGVLNARDVRINGDSIASSSNTVSVAFTRENISISTDYLGRHPTEKAQYNNYALGSTDDNVPETAFTKIEAFDGITPLVYGGHQTTGDPNAGEYQIISEDVVIKTIGQPRDSSSPVNTTGVRTLDTTLETTPSGYPDQAQSSTDPSVGDTSYDIFGRNTQVVFALHVESENNNAKLSVSLLDWTDGSNGSPSIQDAYLFDSVEITVPIKVNVSGNVSTYSRTFTVTKSKSAAPAPLISLNPISVVLPANSSGVVSSHSEGNASIEVYAGSEQLIVDNSSPYGKNTFRVGSPVASNITAGAVAQTDGGTSATSNPSSMQTSSDTAEITFPVTVNLAGEENTYDVVQTFGKSKDGSDGSDGSNGISTVNVVHTADFSSGVERVGPSDGDGSYLVIQNTYTSATPAQGTFITPEDWDQSAITDRVLGLGTTNLVKGDNASGTILDMGKNPRETLFWVPTGTSSISANLAGSLTISGVSSNDAYLGVSIFQSRYALDTAGQELLWIANLDIGSVTEINATNGTHVLSNSSVTLPANNYGIALLLWIDYRSSSTPVRIGSGTARVELTITYA